MSMSCVLLFTFYEICFSFYFGRIKYTLCNYDLDGVYEMLKSTCCWKPVSDSLKWWNLRLSFMDNRCKGWGIKQVISVSKYKQGKKKWKINK